MKPLKAIEPQPWLSSERQLWADAAQRMEPMRPRLAVEAQTIERCQRRAGGVLLAGLLGVWAAEGVDAKGGPSEDSFCRVYRPLAEAMGQKAGKNRLLRPTCSRRSFCRPRS